MKEWGSQYNAFNSMKALAWPDRLRGLAEENYLPPVTVDWDLVLGCNYNCPHCIWGKRRKLPPAMVPDAMIDKVPAFLKSWGVKGVCLSGECGDPLLHPRIADVVRMLRSKDIEVGLTTNGARLHEAMVAAAHYCTYVGISLDAGCEATYNKVKGVTEGWHGVLDNVNALCNYTKGRNLPAQVSLKFIILPDNHTEILQTAEVAKGLGARDFHVRPAWISESDRAKIDLDVVEEQCALAHELEDDNFHVYTVSHKFTGALDKKGVDRCWVAPLRSTWLADGNVALCGDRRDIGPYLCNYITDGLDALRYLWGSPKHVNMVRDVNTGLCKRCICYGYTELVENAFLEDGMNLGLL